MLCFTERDESLSVLESLPQIFALEEAEIDLFRSQDELMIRAGCWARFLKFLTNTNELSTNGSICGVRWRIGSKRVQMKFDQVKYVHRIARWIEVEVANQKLVAAFVPHVYNQNNHSYADHRFVIGCSNDDIVPLVLLFGDHILGQIDGDDAWETDSKINA